MTGDLSRREFLGYGVAVAALGVSPVAAPRSGAAPAVPDDLVVDAAVPLAGPWRAGPAWRGVVAGARRAGVDVLVVPVARGGEGLEPLLRQVLALQERVAADPAARLVAVRADLEGLRPGVGVVMAVPGLQALGEDLSLLRALRAAGVRVVGLTGYWKNWLGDGCLERTDLPLTALGRLAVREIAEAGLVLDLAFAGRRTRLDALERVSGPVIVSRANAAAVHPHPQNLTDDEILAVRARGGVIGLSAFPSLVAAGRPAVDDWFRHLDHVVERAGIEHVGLALDFDDAPRRRFGDEPWPDPPYPYPRGLAGYEDLPGLRDRLGRAGYGEPEIRKLLGGNFVRLLLQALDPRP